MINWMGYVLVAGLTLVPAVVVVGLFAFGVRLDAPTTDSESPRTRLTKTSAHACFWLCGLAVTYGIYLIIPALHK